MELRDKNIVLTGAAGGIGSLLAARLAERGARVVLVDANEEPSRRFLSASSTARPLQETCLPPKGVWLLPMLRSRHSAGSMC